MAQDTQDPKFRIRIRFFRSEGLEKWQVFQIAAGLPLLLQVALLLFFIGLSEFLVLLHPIVGWVSAGIIMSWAGIFLFTVLAPMWSSQCPYKTPVLKTLLDSCRTKAPIILMRSRRVPFLTYHLLEAVQPRLQPFRDFAGLTDRLINWLKEQHEKLKSFELKGSMEESNLRVSPDSDVSIIIASETLFLDAQIKRTIGECIDDSSVPDILKNYNDALTSNNHELDSDNVWKFRLKAQAKVRIDETFIAMLFHKHQHPYTEEEPFSKTLASIVDSREGGRWWTLLPRIAIGFIESGSDYEAVLIFLTLYRSIQGAPFGYIDQALFGDFRHGSLQCEAFALFLMIVADFCA